MILKNWNEEVFLEEVLLLISKNFPSLLPTPPVISLPRAFRILLVLGEGYVLSSVVYIRTRLDEENYERKRTRSRVSYFSRYGEAISHPRLSPAQLLPSYALSFWIHSYLSKRRRYGRICLHFPTMIERDFLEIVAVKLKRHGVIGGSVLILRLHFVASFEIYIPEILCVCHLGIWRKCIFLASSWWNLNL